MEKIDELIPDQI